jgi:hypothetical protein
MTAFALCLESFLDRSVDGNSEKIYWNDWTWILGEKYSPQSS